MKGRATAAPSSCSFRLPNHGILVVEDEKHLAEGLRFNLEAEGYQVNVVDTGEAALDDFKTGSPPFDLVILDVMLPGKDGFEAIAELRQAGSTFQP